MDALHNPFVPGAGALPPTLAGRDDILQLSRVTIECAKLGRFAKPFLLVGLRGVGKTVLLKDAQGYADNAGCASLMIRADKDGNLASALAPGLYDALLFLDRIERAKEAGQIALKTFALFCKAFNLQIHGTESYLAAPVDHEFVGTGILENDVIALFEAVGAAAKEKETAVVLAIDDLHLLGKSELGSLIMAMHKIQQRKLPVVLIGAGLPQLRSQAGNAKSYAERLFDYPEIGPLGEEDAAKAIVEPIEREGCAIQSNAVKELVDLTKGYPYFLQALGHFAWNIAKESPITKSDVASAHAIAQQSLDESFFQHHMDRLTSKERDYVFAMAELGPGPYMSEDIAAKMARKAKGVAQLRSSLMKKGMIYRPIHADAAFTVPLFDRHLRRIQASKP